MNVSSIIFLVLIQYYYFFESKSISFWSTPKIDILSEIEFFPEKEITVMDIDKNACRETLDFTKDTDNNWKKLIRENEKEQKEYWAKKKRKK